MADYVNLVVNIGTIANDDTGDTLRAGMDKLNDNNISLRGAIDWDEATFDVSFFNDVIIPSGDFLISTGGKIILDDSSLDTYISEVSADQMNFVAGGTEGFRLDASRNLIVGDTTSSNHRIRKNVTDNAGNSIIDIVSTTGLVALFQGVSTTTGSANAANAAMKIGKDTTTSRAINAAGTVNASGADYAEYEIKVSFDININKGDIIGFDKDGEITNKFSDSYTFMIKSSDPAYVGGDVWGNEDAIGAVPVEPLLELPVYEGAAAVKEPIKPEFRTPVQLDGESDEEFAGVIGLYNRQKTEFESHYIKLLAVYDANKPQYDADQAAYKKLITAAKSKQTTAIKKYKVQKTAFEIKLEAARKTVDRIAYAGKVPVNGLDSAKAGEYVIAVDDGSGGIKGEAQSSPSFEDYRDLCVGKIKSFGEDERAIVIVKAG